MKEVTEKLFLKAWENRNNEKYNIFLGELFSHLENYFYICASKILKYDYEILIQNYKVKIHNGMNKYNPSRGKPMAWINLLINTASLDYLRELESRKKKEEIQVNWSNNYYEKEEKELNIYCYFEEVPDSIIDSLLSQKEPWKNKKFNRYKKEIRKVMNSKQKGNRGEREAASYLTELFGLKCRRGQQYSGSPDSPDVVGIPGLHLEIKRTERINIYEAIKQAARDANDNVPLVMHRKNREEWLFVLKAEDIFRLMEVLNEKVKKETA